MAKKTNPPENIQDKQKEVLQNNVDEKPSTTLKAQELPVSGVVTIEHIVNKPLIGLVKGRQVEGVSVECARSMINKGFAKLVS